MKALRIFYDSTNKIIWNHGLEGTGKFPQSPTEELATYPMGTNCLEITDAQTIAAFLVSDTNQIVGGKLVVGTPRPPSPPPAPDRDLASELTQIEADIALIKAKLKII